MGLEEDSGLADILEAEAREEQQLQAKQKKSRKKQKKEEEDEAAWTIRKLKDRVEWLHYSQLEIDRKREHGQVPHAFLMISVYCWAWCLN